MRKKKDKYESCFSKDTEKSLKFMFDKINETFFENELQQIKFIKGYSPRIEGYFSNKNNIPILCICVNAINKIIPTLIKLDSFSVLIIHELVHYWQELTKLHDNTTYMHDSVFEKKMNDFGIFEKYAYRNRTITRSFRLTKIKENSLFDNFIKEVSNPDTEFNRCFNIVKAELNEYANIIYEKKKRLQEQKEM